MVEKPKNGEKIIQCNPLHKRYFLVRSFMVGTVNFLLRGHPAIRKFFLHRHFGLIQKQFLLYISILLYRPSSYTDTLCLPAGYPYCRKFTEPCVSQGRVQTSVLAHTMHISVTEQVEIPFLFPVNAQLQNFVWKIQSLTSHTSNVSCSCNYFYVGYTVRTAAVSSQATIS